MQGVYFYLLAVQLVAASLIAYNVLPERCLAAKNGNTNAAIQRLYLSAYCLAMLGDWLQGPYVYALYASYGYAPRSIGVLFIAGFGSSLIFGTLVGAMSDRLGRRNAALLYVAVYSVSCATKHSPKFSVLFCGRILGGIATSLLFSVFESWLTAESIRRDFTESELATTFAWAGLLGNGIMAIFAGLLGNCLSETLGWGLVAPFDAAIVSLVACGVIVAGTWTENYGSGLSKSVGEQFGNAWAVIYGNAHVATVGIIQACFEAGMYTVVFLWTMAMSPNNEIIPHGLVFMNMMAACMIGSMFSAILLRRMPPDKYLPGVFGLAAVALLVPASADLLRRNFHVPAAEPGPHLNDVKLSQILQLLAFCVFEACIGIFWPSIMVMRAKIIPEEFRATIINIYRVPLNLFVCLLLCNVELVPLWIMFGLCSLLMLVALWHQLRLDTIVQSEVKRAGNCRSTSRAEPEGGT